MHTYLASPCPGAVKGAYIHTYIHTYVHTYMHTYPANPCLGDVNWSNWEGLTYIHTHTRIHAHIYIHTYVRTYIHAYTPCKPMSKSCELVKLGRSDI